MNAADPRETTGADIEIGARIRERRHELKLPLKHVAALVGVTYQQLAKYESGDNRISAVMLTKIAGVLKIDPADLLPDAPKRRRKLKAVEEDGLALQLQAAFARISSQKERRLILDLARRLGPPSEKATAPRPRPKRRTQR
jgi:transcriptional regulator with XRE-family HTH domain